MAEGTPGRENQAKAGEKGRVVLDGISRRVGAGVHVFGYSAYTDQQGLLDWVTGMVDKPRMIRLVHGGQDARRVLGAKLMERYRNEPDSDILQGKVADEQILDYGDQRSGGSMQTRSCAGATSKFFDDIDQLIGVFSGQDR
jgi:hypothetical protein